MKHTTGFWVFLDTTTLSGSLTLQKASPVWIACANKHSWGNVFQIALQEASNPPWDLGFGISSDGAAPFSFLEYDLYSDFYSYAALALANYDRDALFHTERLTTVSQKVFSAFSQAFFSLPTSNYGYWAFQPVGEQMPFGLDFEPRVTSMVVSTWTSTSTLCSSSPEPRLVRSAVFTNGTRINSLHNITEMICVPTGYVRLTLTDTKTFVTYPDTRPTPTATSTSSAGRVTAKTLITTSARPDTICYCGEI